MASYDKDVIRLRKEGKSYQEISEILNITHGQVNHAIYRKTKRERFKREYDSYDLLRDEIYEMIKKPVNKKDIIENVGITRSKLDRVLSRMEREGVLVEYDDNDLVKLCKFVIPQENKHDTNWGGEKIIRFALTGDKQFNSKFIQLTHLHDFYDICEREGIETVYDTGDIDEGEEMRMGHKYECYNQGADDHIREIVKNHPRRKGITTKFITGNHDHSLIKRAGYDIGTAIEMRRDDMVYLGPSSAVVELTPNCLLELRHPIDGTAYAISYKTQKMIDALQGGDKPNILAVGHYHKVEYLFYRNIHVYQTGCFQAQTDWMRGKQISAQVGGWIIEVRVNDEGTITRCKGEFIPYYKMIRDDYLDWRS